MPFDTFGFAVGHANDWLAVQLKLCSCQLDAAGLPTEPMPNLQNPLLARRPCTDLAQEPTRDILKVWARPLLKGVDPFRPTEFVPWLG